MAPCLFLMVVLAGNMDAGTRVVVDASAAPKLEAWARSAESLGTEWYGKISTRLGLRPGMKAPAEIRVTIEPEYSGVAYAGGGKIVLGGDWVKNHPEDSKGVLIHEMTHLVQAYPKSNDLWAVEGIADYIRFAIYESKPVDWFPRPQKEKGYLDSYKVAAGFLTWLESGPAPGIVGRLNAAMREGKSADSVFAAEHGKSVDDHWKDYLSAMEKSSQLPERVSEFRYVGNEGGSFVAESEKVWVERRDGRVIWRFTETGRNGTHVELRDNQRNLRLRIGSDRVDLFRDGSWVPIYSGKWVARD